MRLCVVITPTASLLIPVKLPQGPSIREVLGGGGQAGLGGYPPPAPGRGPLQRESSPAPPRPRGAGPGGRAAGGREAEKKGMGGGARSARQREQQIAPSQWQRRDEVAPNSLWPMALQSLQKAISISPGAGAAAAEPRYVCSIQFLRVRPLARLASVSSPPRPCGGPTASQLCALCPCWQRIKGV